MRNSPLCLVLIALFILLLNHIVEFQTEIRSFCTRRQEKHHILAAIHHIIKRNQQRSIILRLNVVISRQKLPHSWKSKLYWLAFPGGPSPATHFENNSHKARQMTSEMKSNKRLGHVVDTLALAICSTCNMETKDRKFWSEGTRWEVRKKLH